MRFSLLLNILGVAAVKIPARNSENFIHRRSESASIQPTATANNDAPAQDGYVANPPEAQTYGADTKPETTLEQAPQVTQSVSIEEDDKKEEQKQKQEETSAAFSEQGDAATETSPKMVYNLACSCNQPAPAPTITGGYTVNPPPPPPPTTTSQLTVVPYPTYTPPEPVTTSTTEQAPAPEPTTSSTYQAPEPSTTLSEIVTPYPPPPVPTTTTSVYEPPTTVSDTPLPPTTTSPPPDTTKSW